MSENKVHIGKEVAAICKKLGLEPLFTGSLLITPTSVDAVVFLKDERGKKHTIPPPEALPVAEDGSESMGFTHTTVATETRTFEVRT